MRFRKKPVEIEAVQFTPRNIPDNVRLEDGQWQVYDVLHATWINLEVGDWIITGVKGETYPCKPDVFEATYDHVQS